MKTLKSDISEAYKYKLTVWKFRAWFLNKNDMKETMSDLFRLHKAMQKKLKNNIILWTDLNSYFGTW